VRIAVLGASGFIGTHLTAALRGRGDDVVTASLREPLEASRVCDGADAVVNLAGEGVAQRWTPEVKEKIRASRVDAPRALIASLDALVQKPRAYISASAVGYYGTSEEDTFVESSPPGSDFLAETCVAWEAEAMRAAEHGLRVAIVRSGVALGTDGGALAKLLPIFRVGGGGPAGNGRQWFSWIHIDDLVGIYLMAIDGGRGVFNGTSPEPVRNMEFTRALAAAVHRPAFFPMPAFALRVMFGEGADPILTGQRVLPERTLASGYAFTHPRVDDAVAALLKPG
jgi:uncharacterized protein (TIGR01777 family)